MDSLFSEAFRSYQRMLHF